MDTLRRRYVALRAEGPPPPAPALEGAVLAALRGAAPSSPGAAVAPKLYHLRPGAAIVRVDHRAQRGARGRLDGLRVAGATLRTVTTSGTLREAKRALGVRSSARRRRGREARRGRPTEPAEGARRPPGNV